MYKRHFIKFSLAITLIFGLGILLLFVINLHDNSKYGESKTVKDRIKEVIGS